MNATEAKPTVRYYFAGEFTTTRSEGAGMIPFRECHHKHRTKAGAERCSHIHGRWVVYAMLSDGRTAEADLLHLSGIDVD